MKYAVVGAGAMGLRYGIQLQYNAGLEVDFVEPTQASLDVIRAQGNKVFKARDHKNRHSLTINIYSPEEYQGDPDVWIFFVKQMQLEEALKRLAPKFKAHQTALGAMNGMGHIAKLQNYFADDHIIGGTAMIATVLPAFGDVDFIGEEGKEASTYANLTETDTPTLRALEADFKAATLGPTITTNCLGTLLTKVIFNSVINSICTMFRVQMGQMITYDRFLEGLARPMTNEAYDACEAEGIQLLETRDEMVESFREVSLNLSLHYPSMYQDFSKGRQTEVDYINGYLADLGEKHGIPMPTQRFVQHLVHLAESMRDFK